MPQKPDGKPAKVERVTFTRDSAERIGKVVRKVEAGNRDQLPFGVGPRLSGGRGKTFRICTFTGSWSIGSALDLTFKYQTTTPNTVSATNLFLPIPDGGTAARDCAIAKDGTAWFLIQTKWDAQDFLSSATLGTAALEFTSYKGVSLGTATTVQISITTCSTAAS